MPDHRYYTILRTLDKCVNSIVDSLISKIISTNSLSLVNNTLNLITRNIIKYWFETSDNNGNTSFFCRVK